MGENHAPTRALPRLEVAPPSDCDGPGNLHEAPGPHLQSREAVMWLRYWMCATNLVALLTAAMLAMFPPRAFCQTGSPPGPREPEGDPFADTAPPPARP